LFDLKLIGGANKTTTNNNIKSKSRYKIIFRILQPYLKESFFTTVVFVIYFAFTQIVTFGVITISMSSTQKFVNFDVKGIDFYSGRHWGKFILLKHLKFKKPCLKFHIKAKVISNRPWRAITVHV